MNLEWMELFEENKKVKPQELQTQISSKQREEGNDRRHGL